MARLEAEKLAVRKEKIKKKMGGQDTAVSEDRSRKRRWERREMDGWMDGTW